MTTADRRVAEQEIAQARRELAALKEHHHRGGQGGVLRASIFGINDGLVSNFSLVLGVAGADPGRHIILLAGVAGLVAGAFSMAAGEYVSMRIQREVFEAEIARERAEIEQEPDKEQAEVEVFYRAQGIPREDARRLASHVMADPEIALDLMVRQELGLDPDELGSPWGAAMGSFVSFSAGALLPLLAFIFTSSTAQALPFAVVLSALALFGVGAATAQITDRPVLYGGARMLLIGAAAASVTYLVGHLLGVSVTG
jgi:VIT1/CCC1 family predicted Fe2+/Mn2+ transporter